MTDRIIALQQFALQPINVIINRYLRNFRGSYRRVWCCMLLLLFLLPLAGCAEKSSPGAGKHEISASELPLEAQATLEAIRRGGAFPYARDGSVFFNRERLLPEAPRGYYREYTVPTPGISHRGARRIVSGSNGELYYTADHYRSFKRIRE